MDSRLGLFTAVLIFLSLIAASQIGSDFAAMSAGRNQYIRVSDPNGSLISYVCAECENGNSSCNNSCHHNHQYETCLVITNKMDKTVRVSASGESFYLCSGESKKIRLDGHEFTASWSGGGAKIKVDC